MSDSDSYEEDCEGLLRKALDVELPDNFNPNSVPQTGEEYLHHVIYERSRCKKWVSAKIDQDKFKNKQTFQIQIDKKVSKAPEAFLPSENWQKQKIADFTEFRKFVQSKITPSHQTKNSLNEEEFAVKMNNSTPLFSDITDYAQASKIRMLQMITKHLESIKSGDSITDNLGTWIYAILTLLDIPLSPSSCHSLREFAKKCAVIRSSLAHNSEDKLYVPLNLYICFVARFFNQLDLVDT